MDRRRFLEFAGAGALGLALPGLGRGQEKDPFGGFVLGVQSYTFRNFDLEPALKRIKELGLPGVEFYSKHAPLNATPAQIEALLKLCKEYGVTPRAFGVQRFRDAPANGAVVRNAENQRRFAIEFAHGREDIGVRG